MSLTLLLIRHAEKPNEAWPGGGLADKGEEDKESLVIRGTLGGKTIHCRS